MCQATVFLLDEQIMADVMSVEIVPEGVRLMSMFEPTRTVAAVVREVDLMKHEVILEPLASQASQSEEAPVDPASTAGGG